MTVVCITVPFARPLIQAGLLIDTDTFYAPSVDGGTALLVPGLFVDDDTIYTPFVSFLNRTLSPGLLTDADTFYAPVTGFVGQVLLPGLFTDTDTFYTPIAVYNRSLTPGLFTDTDTFYAPSMSVGSVITLLTHAIKQSSVGETTNAVTSAIDTTGANFIVIATVKGSSAGTLSDSKGNTWTHLTDQTNSGVHTQLHYCANPTVGTGHTFTYSAATSLPSIAVAAFSDVKTTSPFDVENGANTGSATSLATGSVTPSENSELLVFAIGDAMSTVTVDVGTIIDQLAFIPGTAFAITLAYQVQGSATTRNPTWSWSGAARAEAAIATFKHP